MKRIISAVLAVILSCAALCSCTGKSSVNKNLNLKDPVSLTICGPWTASKAIETASQAFNEKYPNCEIKYEYVQNYEASLSTRMESTPDSVDLFLSDNIQSSSALFPYAEDLYLHSELDLSNTNDALIKNFTLFGNDSDAPAQIYTIPLGGEIRGMYVNKTLLKSVGINDIPKNATQLLDACETLKNAGYVPMQGNPGMFSQRLLYPYVCSLIANSNNYTELYNKVNTCEAGVSELFRKPMEFMYTLAENDYYNYKYIETEKKMFTDNSDEGCARYFFNILSDGDDLAKVDDIGSVAFMSGTFTQKTVLDKIKEDYHSNIDYEFVLAPVSDDGGFAYVSPAKGIAISKTTTQMDWALEFLNFLFTDKVNTKFAEDSNYVPNTKDSFAVIKKQFDVAENHICDLGQMTFDYGFYSIIEKSLVNISKANNPKYMTTDENGNSAMYDFEYYMQSLEKAFEDQRNAGTSKS